MLAASTEVSGAFASRSTGVPLLERQTFAGSIGRYADQSMRRVTREARSMKTAFMSTAA
jgi:hypothetical protein